MRPLASVLCVTVIGTTLVARCVELSDGEPGEPEAHYGVWPTTTGSTYLLGASPWVGRVGLAGRVGYLQDKSACAVIVLPPKPLPPPTPKLHPRSATVGWLSL
jgi:hypothetical protein